MSRAQLARAVLWISGARRGLVIMYDERGWEVWVTGIDYSVTESELRVDDGAGPPVPGGGGGVFQWSSVGKESSS